MNDEILDGYTRVSEILNYYSGLEKVPQNVLERACERGTIVHNACEAIIQGFGVDSSCYEYETYVESFMKWYEQYDELDVKLIPRFYDDELKITGLCDCIVFSPKKTILVDFKTSYTESKTWAVQGGAYCMMAANSEPKIHVDEMHFVHLQKNSSKPVIYNYDIQENIDRFMKCLELYRYFK